MDFVDSLNWDGTTRPSSDEAQPYFSPASQAGIVNPNRVDFAVDLAYGMAIFCAIGLILVVETAIGIAFGLGVLVSYLIHIGWKMARFDPDWMTEEVAQQVKETVSGEVEQTVADTVSEEVEQVAETVERTVSEDVTKEVEQTVSQQVEETVGNEVDDVVEKIDELKESDSQEV